MGINQVVLFGNCGKDPACKEVGDNKTPIAEFSLATSKPPRVKGGKWESTWHTVKSFGKTALKIRDKLRQGDFVAVMGEIETESWDDRDGNKKYRTVVKVMWPDNICIEQRDNQPANEADQSNGNW